MTQEGKTTSDATNEEELKGTFSSVLSIGAFILVLWLIVFFIYFTR